MRVETLTFQEGLHRRPLFHCLPGTLDGKLIILSLVHQGPRKGQLAVLDETHVHPWPVSVNANGDDRPALGDRRDRLVQGFLDARALARALQRMAVVTSELADSPGDLVLVEIDRVEVHAVDLPEGVLRVDAARTKQESIRRGHTIRRHEELLLHPHGERRRRGRERGRLGPGPDI